MMVPLLQTLVNVAADQSDDTKRVAAVQAILAAERKAGAEINFVELDAAVAAEYAGTHGPTVTAALGAVVNAVRAIMDTAAHTNSVSCPECDHPLEAHNRRGCQVAGTRCHCYQRPLTWDIQIERQRHGLPAAFDIWDYRPRRRATQGPP